MQCFDCSIEILAQEPQWHFQQRRSAATWHAQGGSTPSTQSRAFPLSVFADECSDAPADGCMRCGVGINIDV